MARHEGSGFVWFLAGAALGAAVALLAAPQPGEETRRRLRQRAEEGRERFYEASRSAAGRGRGLVEEAAESGRQALEKGRELYRQGRDLADDAASELQDAPTPEPLAESSEDAAAEPSA